MQFVELLELTVKANNIILFIFLTWKQNAVLTNISKIMKINLKDCYLFHEVNPCILLISRQGYV